MFNVVKSVLAPMLLFFCLAVPAEAGWSIYKRAAIRSQDKNILRIDRQSGSPVRAWFFLRHKAAGAFESKFPLYRVDNHEVRDLESAKDVRTDKKKNYWVRWHIYDGKGDINDDLRELMNGKEMIIQYYLPGGVIKESIFPLKGAREAIEEVLR